MGVIRWGNQEPDRLIMISERNLSKDWGVITKIDTGSDRKMVREILNRCKAIGENNPTKGSFKKIMEEEADMVQKNGKDKPNEKLEEMKIERLDEKRKTLKKKKREKQPLKRLNTQN
ncbi:hypothetical protein PoB_007669500 [Plakobranchus ocellatus]|uniref:Uncharacterized protein n=1 Tax=Plakobranchus ocellatus TaxID=259542 RepID=A0AAV4E1H7_9GAST|nr:hypothetical protein PoB_007669500 [Plakobranchus ocellatus]